MTIDLSILYTVITVIASLIGSLGVICVFLRKAIDKAVDKIQQPILEKIDKLDENHCKDYLISFLNDVKNGVHKNQYEISRAHDVYEHYINVLHKNSYIHAMWEEVMGNKEERE